MATLGKNPNGSRRLLFTAPDGSRPTIHLGKANQRTAETIKRHVEHLLACKAAGLPPDPETLRWSQEIDDKLATKLVKTGLLAPRQVRGETTLGPFLDSYFAARTDVKESTKVNWRQTRRLLLAYFGADRPLASITKGEAKDWERWLRTGEAREGRYAERTADEGLAPPTARKRVSHAKQFFADAVNRELIQRNPFAGLKGGVGSNRERDYFVARDACQKILEACPDTRWKLIFSLARFGGLRCPSEIMALTWNDVDWAENRLTIPSPKTEHHEGKEERTIPIFPELRTILDEAWELLPEGTPGNTPVVAPPPNATPKDPLPNLATHMKRIIKRAGLEP